MASNSTVLPGVPSNIALLTGPILLGNLFGYGLYGILVVQLFIYYHGYPKDSVYLKGTVYFTFFVDTLITVFATIGAWDELAAGWGDLSTLTPVAWPIAAIPLLSGLVASVVHFFFAWRIWKLTRFRILPLCICTVSLLAFIMAGYAGVRSRLLGVLHLNDQKPFVIVWLGGSTFVDIVITISMVTLLFRAKKSTTFQTTHSGISKLITVTIETGMATAIGALVELILFVVFPMNNLHFIVFLVLAKLYSNTLLATLNSRASLITNRGQTGKPALWNDQRSDSTSGSSHIISQGTQAQSRVPIPPVQITTVTERHHDPKDIEMFIMERENNDRYTKRSDWM
ncbi:hypothetical protein BDZ94DRAFT_782352 [Collybia nuda]|uniref:DUF6534 domain-containing protein n=1 Tax=Collybia nuda TaxID=64659 RepID=A0A9P5YGU2_9AGAR|nr:hypothetical protein BDZ94DRAFT_782352 [Collybia nuda]